MMFDPLTYGVSRVADFNRDAFVSNHELYVAFKTGRIDFSYPPIEARYRMLREVTGNFQTGYTGLTRDEAVFLLFIIPTLVAIGLFIYYPAASGIFHSFFRWNGADISEWQGVGNYTDLLTSSLFWHSFRNAFLLGMWNVIKMIPPLFVAVAIHRCRSTRMQFFYRILFVIPMVVPPLIIALVWRSFFFEANSGYLNRFIEFANLRGGLNLLAPLFGWGDAFAGAGKPAWLGDPRLIFTACVVWGFPWVSSLAVLTHLAKLQSISKDVYEAGDIDGVSWWSKFTKIELPLITGSIYIMLVFMIIGTVGVMHFMTAWNDFVLPLIVMRDHARLPVMVQLIRMAGEYIKLWGPLMAGYAMAAIPIIILFIFSMKLFVRGMTEGAVKG